MERHILFPQVDALLHGGDYNPEQWLDRPDILEEDIRLMKKAGVNTATLGVFSWSMYEPREGEYHFEWMDEIIDNLYQNGIYTILATPSGARPAWLDEKYPEAMRTNSKGDRNLHGQRHNHCMSSEIYRKKVVEMDKMLAKRYGKHPGILMWHISNELGGECFCDLCRAKFQQFLREKYHNNIEELNQAWWTTFWSHRFNDFSQIDPPSARGEKTIHGMNLDWKRFTTWNMTDFMKTEIAVFKEETPDIPVTTNFMHLYPALDYHVMAKELDVISWDSYPRWNTADESLWDTAAGDAFDQVTMRSFKKDRPFMMMESVPSLVNWHEFNKLKRPKVHMLTSMHTIACGSDTVQYFQWRKGRGSFEQYHGAVLDHLGRSDTRVFKDVEEVGKVLGKLKEVQGTLVKAKAALIFDWDTRWAIEDMAALAKKTKKYPETCIELFKIFLKHGVEVDIISQEDDFEEYDMIVAPMMYLLKPKTAERMKEFVKNGGQLLTTYLCGYVDETTLCYLGGFPGDGLMDLFGLYAEEIDTLYPKDKNGVRFVSDSSIQGTYAAKDYCEILKVQDAQVLAEYTDDFYEGTPAITVKQYGAGKAYYVGARTDSACMEAIFSKMWEEQGIQEYPVPAGVEYHRRSADGKVFDFFMNYTQEEQEIMVEPGAFDVLHEEMIEGSLLLEPLGTAVIVYTLEEEQYVL